LWTGPAFLAKKLPGVAAIIADLDAAVAEQSFAGLPISIRHGQAAGPLPGPHRDPFGPAPIAAAPIDGNRTAPHGSPMTDPDRMPRKGAEEARNRLPELLAAAEQGQSTIITRHGRPIAALVPIAALAAAGGQQPLTPLAGSERPVGKDSARTLRRLRAEWSR
jgi:prevent-host-death family protein